MWDTSTDAKTAIDAEGYFNSASGVLKVATLSMFMRQQVVHELTHTQL